MGLDPWQRQKIFLIGSLVTLTPIQQVQGVLSPCVKELDHDDRAPASSAKVVTVNLFLHYTIYFNDVLSKCRGELYF